MTRFLVHEAGDGGRAIHALVIGVGDYPHLNGGSGLLTTSHGGMGQLTSPPVSARAMADWLARDLNHPDFSKKTVGLLLSERTPEPFTNPVTGAVHQVERADFENVRNAIKDWKARGSKSVDDMLVFYFCGHGMSEGVGSMVILPSDFGSDPENAYDSSVDFVNIHDAMEQAAATTQCYFIDACRASTDTLPENGGRKVLQAGPRLVPGVRVAPVYYAALVGKDAHGRPGKRSLFTETLVKCLDDFAAVDNEGDWRVSNFSLSRALDHMMARIRTDSASLALQVPITVGLHSEFYIHHLARPPKANVYVTTKPPELIFNLDLFCRYGEGQEEQCAATEAGEWAFVVPSGKVFFKASNAPIDEEIEVKPLFRSVKLS